MTYLLPGIYDTGSIVLPEPYEEYDDLLPIGIQIGIGIFAG
jgi:hypothetical protein